MNSRYGYLQFLYDSPINPSASPNYVPFPVNTPINIIYVDDDGTETRHSGNPIMTDAEGKITFLIEHRTNLYFEIEFSEPTYINVTSGTLMPQSTLNSRMQQGSLNFTQEMIFMLPQRFNLRNAIWAIDDVPVFDRNHNIFHDLENNLLRGGSGHLRVILSPEWQYVGFQYYDRHAKAKAMVPQFILLEGYNESVSDDTPVTKSNVFTNNSVCLPWILARDSKNTRSPERITLKFRSINSVVQSGGGVIRHTRDEVRAMPLRDRFQFYDIPEEFSSRNWQAKFGEHSSIMFPFQDRGVVNGNTTYSNPLVFELDSVVLTDDECEWESDWNRNNRFTFFDIKMSISNPDGSKPYYTTGTVDSDFFSMGVTGDHPRVISVNGKFYDITDKRSTGDLIGARAAVLDDEQVHYGDDIQRPVSSMTGNFELHYFKDCLDVDDNVVSALLIYWSCKLGCGTGTTNADITNFQQSGMINAKQRWEQKGYKFKPQSGVNPEAIPVFFFEARESNPFKCTVTLHPAGNGRSSMGITSGDFMSDDYQQDAATADPDVDNQMYGWFTMAHEIGHAMGLDDEYAESVPEDNSTDITDGSCWNPPLPQFDQYYPGVPYSCDTLSMMQKNKAPRLRHLWYYCRWINATDEVKNLSSNTVFKVHHAGKNYNYSLIEDYINFYEPAYDEEDFDNGDYGEFDLFLYKIGNDETTDRLITGQSNFDGILVVRSKLQWFFDNYLTHTWSSTTAKLRYMRDFHTRIDQVMNNKYYLECSSDSEFKKVYVFFKPHYKYAGSTPSDHFEITVKANSGATVNFQPEFFEDDFDDDDFEIDARQDFVSIYRYILGLVPYEGNPRQSKTSIASNELNFLATWIGSQRGQTYQLRY
jgi:hypothetical protein